MFNFNDVVGTGRFMFVIASIVVLLLSLLLLLSSSVIVIAQCNDGACVFVYIKECMALVNVGHTVRPLALQVTVRRCTFVITIIITIIQQAGIQSFL